MVRMPKGGTAIAGWECGKRRATEDGEGVVDVPTKKKAAKTTLSVAGRLTEDHAAAAEINAAEPRTLSSSQRRKLSIFIAAL